MYHSTILQVYHPLIDRSLNQQVPMRVLWCNSIIRYVCHCAILSLYYSAFHHSAIPEGTFRDFVLLLLIPPEAARETIALPPHRVP